LPCTSSHKNFGCISDFLCQCCRSHHLIILRIHEWPSRRCRIVDEECLVKRVVRLWLHWAVLESYWTSGTSNTNVKQRIKILQS
jgi:hypothetical protein